MHSKDSPHASSLFYTIIGQISLVIWAMAATLAVSLIDIPTFEILFCITGAGFITSSIINTYFGNWKKLRNHPIYMWIIGIFGVTGNDIFYIMSFKNAPPVHVDLINYLWPILVIVGSGIFLNEKIKWRHFMGVIIAFLAIYILLMGDEDPEIYLQEKYYTGYIYAFTAAILWSSYVVLSRRYGIVTFELFSVYGFLGTIIAGILHLRFEETVIPNNLQFLSLLAMGTLSHCLAYLMWDIGIKRGNFRLLNVLSYTCPLISVCILVLSGYATFTPTIIVAASLITAAALIAR